MKVNLLCLYFFFMICTNVCAQEYLNQSATTGKSLKTEIRAEKLAKKLRLTDSQKEEFKSLLNEKQDCIQKCKAQNIKLSREKKIEFSQKIRSILNQNQLTQYYSKTANVKARYALNAVILDLISCFKLTKEQQIYLHKELFRTEFEIAVVKEAYKFEKEERKKRIKQIKAKRQDLLEILERICVGQDPHSLKRSVAYGEKKAKKTVEELQLSPEKVDAYINIETKRYKELEYLPFDNFNRVFAINIEYRNSLRKLLDDEDLIKIYKSRIKKQAKNDASLKICKAKYKKLNEEFKQKMFQALCIKYAEITRLQLLHPGKEREEYRKELLGKILERFQDKERELLDQNKLAQKDKPPYSYSW